MSSQQMLLGGGGSEKLYVQDVFSTVVYRGSYNSSMYQTWTKAIDNGIDLVNKGGLVWIKNRSSNNTEHVLYDTERGVKKYLATSNDSGEVDETNETGADEGLDLWLSQGGFRLGGGDDKVNEEGEDYVSWTFRKAKGFFDVVKWDGDGNASRQISHGLGSVPGMIWIKQVSSSYSWYTYHRKLNSTNPHQYYVRIASSAGRVDTSSNNAGPWLAAAPTDTHFTLAANLIENFTGGWGGQNTDGQSYVAYVFAHDSQIYGQNSNQSIIKCDSYEGNGQTDGPEINLGWEPQWLMVKNIDTGSSHWWIHDSTRNIVSQAANSSTSGMDKIIQANRNYDEAEGTGIDVTPTGFKVRQSAGNWNGNNQTIIYVAIRRPDGYVSKPVTSGQLVFGMDDEAPTSLGSKPKFLSHWSYNDYQKAFPVDFALLRKPTVDNENNWASARLIGGNLLRTNDTNNEATDTNAQWDTNQGWFFTQANFSSDWRSWMWKRHSGFDVVTYTGTGSSMAINHSLSQKPQMMWIKNRITSRNWVVYHEGLNGGTNPAQYELTLNDNTVEAQSSIRFNDTEPTSTQFTVGTSNRVNATGDKYLAMLFASVDGISKVGYYNGSNNTITITTGFQPRFLIVKRVTGSSDANWWVFDTMRGWGTNTQGLKLNEDDDQENLGNISTRLSTGFTLTNNNQWNGDGEKYIYYAHA